MIALDTNILVRHLVQDHPQQSKLASRLIENLASHHVECYISDIVLCESVWVLESCYRQKRNAIAEILNKVLLVNIFLFDTKEDILGAVKFYRENKGDFADYLIALRSHRFGARIVYTFDKDLGKNKLFKLLR